MSSTIRMALAFAGGFITGGVAVYFYLNDKYAEISRNEISEYRSEVRGRLRAALDLEEAFKESKEAYEDKKESLSFTDYTSYFDSEEETEEASEESEEASEESEEELEYLDSLNEHMKLNNEMEEARKSGLLPYPIERGDFFDDKQWYDKLNYVYYKGDDILADDRDDAIDNPEELIGKDFREMFGRDADDPDVLYIRNEQCSIDFEISRVESCYSEEYPWVEIENTKTEVIIGGEE